MLKQGTRNFPLTQKLVLIRDRFPTLKISKSTLYKMQRKALNFSYKRITQYKPRGDGAHNKVLKRIAYMSSFLDFLEDETCELFVIDEVGFGTKCLKRYGYSEVGTSCAWEKEKMLSHNMTCIATISASCTEFLQFFTEKGTTSEMFEGYFSSLVSTLHHKYPNKELVFVLDNLCSHKTSFIMKILDHDDHCYLLLTPSCTPQFSPIENMFGQAKRLLSKRPLPPAP